MDIGAFGKGKGTSKMKFRVQKPEKRWTLVNHRSSHGQLMKISHDRKLPPVFPPPCVPSPLCSLPPVFPPPCVPSPLVFPCVPSPLCSLPFVFPPPVFPPTCVPSPLCSLPPVFPPPCVPSPLCSPSPCVPSPSPSLCSPLCSSPPVFLPPVFLPPVFLRWDVLFAEHVFQCCRVASSSCEEDSDKRLELHWRRCTMEWLVTISSWRPEAGNCSFCCLSCCSASWPCQSGQGRVGPQV